MIDVHPPHEPIHGWRDFFLHLTTITIGLLIALSLEGCVEWQHHRHLVHQAEASLHTEIKNNAGHLHDALENLHKQQEELKQDMVVLKYISKHHAAPHDSSLTVHFFWNIFNNVSWLTAQSTSALSYMPYAAAQEYSDIYNLQAQMQTAAQQGVQDSIPCMSLFFNQPAPDAVDPTEGKSESLMQNIVLLQGQLLLVETDIKALDDAYKKFLAAHPD